MLKISVILPAYNAELYIREAIDSILNQTEPDFEFLIFNDGSTDATDKIIKSYNDDRIVYKNEETNIGHLDLLNEGLSIAKGKYIARMDADDVALPNRFEEQFNYLEAHPDVGICGSWYEQIGDETGIYKKPVTFEEIQYHLFYGCPLTHPTVMMRNEFLKKYNLKYDKKYYYAEDHEFFFRSSFHFKLVNLPIVLLKYRIHATQIGSAKWMQQLQVKNAIQAKIFATMLRSCSSSDMAWLVDFFTEHSIPNQTWLYEVDSFKQRIIDENEEKAVYPLHILRRAANELFESKATANFYKHYFRKYYNQKVFDLTLLRYFFREEYKPYKFLGPKLTLLFLVKCLLGYKKSKVLSI